MTLQRQIFCYLFLVLSALFFSPPVSADIDCEKVNKDKKKKKGVMYILQYISVFQRL